MELRIFTNKTLEDMTRQDIPLSSYCGKIPGGFKFEFKDQTELESAVASVQSAYPGTAVELTEVKPEPEVKPVSKSRYKKKDADAE